MDKFLDMHAPRDSHRGNKKKNKKKKNKSKRSTDCDKCQRKNDQIKNLEEKNKKKDQEILELKKEIKELKAKSARDTPGNRSSTWRPPQSAYGPSHGPSNSYTRGSHGEYGPKNA